MSARDYARVQRLKLALGAMLLCSGCLGTETGNPSETRDVSVALVLRSSNSNIAQYCVDDCERNSNGLHVTDAWLATSDLDVHGCVGSDESDVPATAWDLLHPWARRVETNIPSFCGFALRTWPTDANLGGIPAELGGSSIWVHGVRADNVGVDIRTPVVIDIAKPSSSAPISDSRLVIAIDAAAWLAGIDFNALPQGADGIVHVNESSNPVQLQLFERQTSADMVLREEDSDDGVTDN